VLRSQAADVREAGKRRLLEAGGRKEIAMMVTNVRHTPSKLAPDCDAARANAKAGFQVRDALPMNHPDFYTVATTVVLVFMLGCIYIVSYAHVKRDKRWILAFFYVTNILPGALVINWSLEALGSDGYDTPMLRSLVYWAVLIQAHGGGGTLLLQSIQQQHRDSP